MHVFRCGTCVTISRYVVIKCYLHIHEMSRDYDPDPQRTQTSAILLTKMASIIGSEVEIQEVEIESVPVELPIETVETSDVTIEIQPMIALQPLPETGHEEIVLQTREEVVGDLVGDGISVPAPDIELVTEDVTTSRKGKGGKKKGGRSKFITNAGLNELSLDMPASNKKWEQKQVQIKTLEGEFSVTMWASGKHMQ